MKKNHYYPPALLDRLLDDEPKSEHDRYRHVDAKKIRLLVQQEIADLLNSTSIEDRLDMSQHGVIMGSVINYGVPAIAGIYEKHHNWNTIEKSIRTAILRFEPRIIPETLLVRSMQENKEIARHALILFEIRGLIDWSPRPVDICISGRYDVESEKVELKSD